MKSPAPSLSVLADGRTGVAGAAGGAADVPPSAPPAIGLRRPSVDAWAPATLTLLEAADGGVSGVLSAGAEFLVEIRRATRGNGPVRCEVRVSETAQIEYFARLRGDTR